MLYDESILKVTKSLNLFTTEETRSQRESIELTPTEPNKSQITLSKELERKVESQELAIGISITNVSTYKELYEAKSQDNKDFVENIDKEPTDFVGD
ncbi:hypothetical protein EfmGK961_14230 [Enterococcus faecium]|nr:hypothetical protein [Enterococcus faecium]BDP97607.1 hypothetical protein EfmGK961_14230 [Enterococcus faecium]